MAWRRTRAAACLRLGLLFLPVMSGCSADQPASAATPLRPSEFSCASGQPGWQPALAVTPDLVPPCNTGSGGKCATPDLRYVRGTGWCRP